MTQTKLSSSKLRLSHLAGSPRPRELVFILDGVSKTISFVHIFRLAEAFSATVIFLHATPKAVRSGEIGRLFSRWKLVKSLCVRTHRELLIYLRQRRISPIAVEVTKTSRPYFGLRALPRTVALIVGSEERGVSPSLLRLLRSAVFVPMYGESSCLSVGMTLAIVAAHFMFLPRRSRQASANGSHEHRRNRQSRLGQSVRHEDAERATSPSES